LFIAITVHHSRRSHDKESNREYTRQTVSSVQFADSKALMASTQKEHLMDNLSRVTKKYGMKINALRPKSRAYHAKKIIS